MNRVHAAFLLILSLLAVSDSHARSPFVANDAQASSQAPDGLPDDPEKLKAMVKALQQQATQPRAVSPEESRGPVIMWVDGKPVYRQDLTNPQAKSQASEPKAAETEKKPVDSKALIRINEPKEPRKVKRQAEPPMPKPVPAKPIMREPLEEKQARKAGKEKVTTAEAKPAKAVEEALNEAKARAEEVKRSKAKKDTETTGPKKPVPDQGAPSPAPSPAKAKDVKAEPEPERKPVPVQAQPTPPAAPKPDYGLFKAARGKKPLATVNARSDCRGQFWPKNGKHSRTVSLPQSIEVFAWAQNRPECPDNLAYDVGQGWMCGSCFDAPGGAPLPHYVTEK